MTLQPLLLGVLYFPFDQPVRTARRVLRSLPDQSVEPNLRLPEMKRIFLGQSPCVYRRHTWTNTHSTGWWPELIIEMNTLIANYV